MDEAITILYRPGTKTTEILIQADTEETQKALEPIAPRIKLVLDRPHFKVRLGRLLLPWAAAILTRMKFTPRRSLLLDRLILWAEK